MPRPSRKSASSLRHMEEPSSRLGSGGSPPVLRRELFAWAMYDFANSGYTTVVLTTIFNAYFVAVVAGGAQGYANGTATLLWTVAVGLANAAVICAAPVLGAVADHLAIKKRLLVFTTIGCVGATALLGLAGPGDIVLAMTLIVLSNIMFGCGDNLIAAFLPELAPRASMGRLSGYGWSLGYFGGVATLLVCLAWISWAIDHGQVETQYVPACMLLVACVYALAAVPTFLWLRERAVPSTTAERTNLWRAAFVRLRHTLAEATRFRDLFRFLGVVVVYQSGISAVIVLAAIYAREVFGIENQDLIVLVLIINLTAALGAFAFGHLQDRLGSVRTLAITLCIWIAAIGIASQAKHQSGLWIAGNLIGAAMGASQSAGRALIGQLTPTERTAEFFGLWGLAMKAAAILGPLSYGFIAYLTGGNHRLAILSCLLFFVIGLGLLVLIDEKRGVEAARSKTETD